MIKINMGCGSKNFGPDWVHIDGSDFAHVDHKSITQLPYDDNKVDLIYASHVLEYFDREEAEGVLKEWHRVLKPNGVLRLAVPDFAECAKLYVNEHYPLKAFVGMLYGKWLMSDGESGKIYHKTVYDFLSLKKVLKDASFKGIKRWNWRETDHSHIDDYSQAYLPHMEKDTGTLISLNVEATK